MLHSKHQRKSQIPSCYYKNWNVLSSWTWIRRITEMVKVSVMQFVFLTSYQRRGASYRANALKWSLTSFCNLPNMLKAFSQPTFFLRFTEVLSFPAQWNAKPMKNWSKLKQILLNILDIKLQFYLGKENLPGPYVSFCVLHPHRLSEILAYSTKWEILTCYCRIKEKCLNEIGLEMSSVQTKTKAVSIWDAIPTFFNSVCLIPVHESCSKHAATSPAALLHDFPGNANRCLLPLPS